MPYLETSYTLALIAFTAKSLRHKEITTASCLLLKLLFVIVKKGKLAWFLIVRQLIDKVLIAWDTINFIMYQAYSITLPGTLIWNYQDRLALEEAGLAFAQAKFTNLWLTMGSHMVRSWTNRFFSVALPQEIYFIFMSQAIITILLVGTPNVYICFVYSLTILCVWILLILALL